MKKEDWGIVLSIIATLLSVVISDIIPNLVVRVLFIVCFAFEIILFFVYQSSKSTIENHRKRMKCIKIVLISLGFIIIGMFVPMLFLHSDSSNQEGVKVITQKMDEQIKGYSKSYADLQTDRKEVEIFYKMKISIEPYYYSDIIKAFEEKGIHFKELSIDENVLMRWDTQMLYANYQMQKEIKKDLNKNITYDKKLLRFEDYKITQSSYKDTLNYEGWQTNYSGSTAEEAYNQLDKTIMAYYNKFSMNLTSSSK